MTRKTKENKYQENVKKKRSTCYIDLYFVQFDCKIPIKTLKHNLLISNKQHINKKKINVKMFSLKIIYR